MQINYFILFIFRLLVGFRSWDVTTRFSSNLNSVAVWHTPCETLMTFSAAEASTQGPFSVGFKNFIEGILDFKSRVVMSILLLNYDTLKAIVEVYPTKTTPEYANDLNVEDLTIVRHLDQFGKVKKLHKCMPHELNDYSGRTLTLQKLHVLSCETLPHLPY